MIKIFLPILVLGLTAWPAFAHYDPADPTHHNIVEVTVNADDEFADEGLKSQDLSDDVEAEVLPDEGWRFGWENAWFNIRRAFTLSAERKSALDRERLHRLDIKLAACADLGDEDCVQKIEDRIKKAEERAKAFIARRQELRDKLEERFANWRASRGERLEKMRLRVQERRDRLEQLRAERQSRLQELREQKRQELNERRQSVRSSLQTTKEKAEVLEQDVNQQRLEFKSYLNSEDLLPNEDGIVHEVVEKEVTNDSARLNVRQEINASNNQSVSDRLEVKVSTDGEN